MKAQSLYTSMFPVGKKIRFPKTKWMILIIIQELKMRKYKAIIKYFYRKSYRKDINFLKDILSKGKLSSTKSIMRLGSIHYSHEINYPEWVRKIEDDLMEDSENYHRIKVYQHEGKMLVIDGNHRLKALNNLFPSNKLVKVLHLSY